MAESTELTHDIIARSDVLYCTRVQGERFEDPSEYEAVKDSLVVDNSVLRHAKKEMVVLHPLPRNKEISEEVDFDPRAAYFRQVRLSDQCMREGYANQFLDAIWFVHENGIVGAGHGAVRRFRDQKHVVIIGANAQHGVGKI